MHRHSGTHSCCVPSVADKLSNNLSTIALFTPCLELLLICSLVVLNDKQCNNERHVQDVSHFTAPYNYDYHDGKQSNLSRAFNTPFFVDASCWSPSPISGTLHRAPPLSGPIYQSRPSLASDSRSTYSGGQIKAVLLK